MSDNDPVLKQTGIPRGSTLLSVQVDIVSITHPSFKHVIMWIQKDDVRVRLNYKPRACEAKVSASFLSYNDSGNAPYNSTNNVVQSGT
jgi:hypothetical protein